VPDYDRAKALAYARAYWSTAATDQYVAIEPQPYFKAVPAGTVFKQVVRDGKITDEFALLPDGSKIEWKDLEDCTHFVSCCLGSPPGGTGGGLPIRQEFNTIYGQLSADKLFNTMKADGLIELVTERAEHSAAAAKLGQIQAGDLIFYWNARLNRYGHSGIYLADAKKRIACHTYCRCDQTDAYDQAWDSVEFKHYTLAKVK
jgi:hypothetical protein